MVISTVSRTPATVCAVLVHVTSAADERLADYRGVRFRSRESDDYFIVETALAIERLISSRYPVRSILLTQKRVEAMGDMLKRVEAPVFVLPPEEMAEVVGFDVHRGALASAARLPLPSLAEVLPTARRLLVVEGCNDLGAMARAAAGLGIDAMLLDSTSADPLYRRSVRVSMGELLRLPLVRCGLLGPVLGELHDAGIVTWALTPAADAASIWALDVPERVALLVGAEGPGLRATTIAAAQHRVRIPMHHGVDSLNVGHAAAIAMAALDR
jgi:tRNA G18 (ribose-2'-O)-methylase SpoU